MKSKIQLLTIKELMELNASGILKPNWEYQRGAVWNEDQMRLLVDSIFRGYQIPLIYLHERKVQAGGIANTYLEVIDGQQRINTLSGFVRGVSIKDSPKGRQERPFKPLFNPLSQEDKKHFPFSLTDKDVSWAGQKYDTLSEELRERFMDTKVSVVYIDCEDDEARDLFIRLQGGRALTPQEVRDGRPGEICKLVLRIGGKFSTDESVNQLGHEFFQKMSSFKAGSPKTRQLVGQVLMLYLNQQEKGRGEFVTINSSALDDFYIKSLSKRTVDEIGQFVKILDKLAGIFGKYSPTFQGHFVIHLVLLTSMLMDEYAPTWEGALVKAQDQFAQKLSDVKKNYKNTYPDGEPQETKDIWEYDTGTRQRSDSADAIRRRHEIYVRLMMEYMGDKLKPLDVNRAYTAEEREYIYRRDGKTCVVCESPVAFDEAEIHHKVPHHQGGQTTLENGVLMHQVCHKQHHRSEGQAR